MSTKTFSLVAGVIFLLVGLAHALRLTFSWHVEVNGWIVPLWLSWIALVVALYLAWQGLSLARKA